MTTFNQFQKELQKRNISPENAFMFSLIYERLIHMAHEQESAAKAILAMAETISGFVELHEATEKKLESVRRGGRPDGVDVYSESVVDDPDKKN